jgi:hypothetical protein
MAAPIPLPAPVTSARLPRNPSSMVKLRNRPRAG